VWWPGTASSWTRLAACSNIQQHKPGTLHHLASPPHTTHTPTQVGTIIELLTARRGDLLEVAQVEQGFGAAPQQHPDAGSGSGSSSSGGSGSGSGVGGSGRQRLLFEVPARGMIGFKSLFAGITRGEGIMQRSFSR
jgi:uncharacterized membrane protein YgcG